MTRDEVVKPEDHPFEQFKSAMRKVVSVPKSELDAKLKAHNEQKQERRAVSKTKRLDIPIR